MTLDDLLKLSLSLKHHKSYALNKEDFASVFPEYKEVMKRSSIGGALSSDKHPFPNFFFDGKVFYLKK